MQAVMDKTGICATVGIGTNLYLAKIAMDIVAKHIPEHIGILTEELYQKYLWKHQPLTDSGMLVEVLLQDWLNMAYMI